MSDPRTEVVAAGYGATIDIRGASKSAITGDPRDEWCAGLIERPPAGAHALEAGCGGGNAETDALAERHRLTAVDLPSAQLRRVRARVPAADHLLAGPTTVELPRGSLDAVAAFYVHWILGRT